MVSSVAEAPIWEEIESSESYLVCCMFEEAGSLASAVLKRICTDKSTEVGEIQLHDMMEAAGMVLVQSLKELGRTPHILNELKELFGSVTAIPFQVLLSGACIQISDGSCLGVKEFLEEFLSKWRCVDDRHYALVGAEANIEGSDSHFVLGVDDYLEIVEVYVVRLLGMVLKEMDLAMSWVEKAALPEEKRQELLKAALPEEKRQELLRRLHSLYSHKATNMSQVHLLEAEEETHSLNISEKVQHSHNGDNAVKQAIMQLHGRKDSCFWWFRTINLKLGSAKLTVSSGKMVVGCLIFLICYVFRRKQTTLNRIVRRQVSSMKKALADLWGLAFSYQVNPLAAVQSLAATTRGSG